VQPVTGQELAPSVRTLKHKVQTVQSVTGQELAPVVVAEGQTMQFVTGQELTSVAPKLTSSRRYGRTAQPGAITGLETEEKATS